MKFTPTDAQRKFAGRLRQRRNELGMTQKDVAERINAINTAPDKTDITSYTVANWERGHTPRTNLMALLCEALNVSPSYLMAMTEIDGANTVTRSSGNDMTQIPIEELVRHGGEPVWVRPFDTRLPEYCAIISNVYDYLITADEQRVPFTSIQGTVWTMPYLADKTVLSLDEAKGSERVYMDPIRTPREVRRRLSGWYRYNKAKDIFIKEDGSYAFPLSHYSSMFVGYKDDPNRF